VYQVHVLVAETAAELVAKFRSDILRQKTVGLTADRILTMAGHHMCRRVGKPASFSNDLRLTAATGVPFDSDCVDERLVPTAFEVAGGYDDIRLLLANRSLVLPLVLQTRPEQTKVACITLSSPRGQAARETCALGKFNNVDVTYPDVFATNFSTWMSEGLDSVEEAISVLADGSLPLSGLRWNNIRPTNEDPRGQAKCAASQPDYLPRGLDVSGLPCLASRLPSRNVSLYTVHSQYGREAVAVANRLRTKAVLFTDMVSMEMPVLAVFLGSKWESTWDGMARY
jgi:hypothetical protein